MSPVLTPALGNGPGFFAVIPGRDHLVNNYCGGGDCLWYTFLLLERFCFFLRIIMKRFVFLLICVLIAFGSGCGRDEGGAKGKELVFYCAAGIRPAVAEIISAFEAESDWRIVADYAGSEVLLSKIKLVRKGDLYMPGDKYYIGQADEAGMIGSSEAVFYWVPVILVQKGNPKGIGGLEDLLKEGVKVGVGDGEACAIGRMTRKIFDKNGITASEIEGNVKFQSQTVNELGIQIQAGALDAVIVWDAIGRYYEEHGDIIGIDLEKNVVSSVDLGVLKFSENMAGAQEFVDFVTSEKGRAIFGRHNYSTVAPK